MQVKVLEHHENWESGKGYNWSLVVEIDGEKTTIEGNYDGVQVPGDGPLTKRPNYARNAGILNHLQEEGLIEETGYAIYNGDEEGPETGEEHTVFDPPIFLFR